MSIVYKEKEEQFHLHTRNTSYIIEVLEGRYPVHTYWGRKLRFTDRTGLVDLREVCSFSPNPLDSNKTLSFDTMPREYPDYGRSDYQSPALSITDSSGSHLIDPVYDSFRIEEGRSLPQGMPGCRLTADDGCDTLVLTLRDSILDLYIDLYYSVSEEYDVIIRRTEIRNCGNKPVTLNKVLSSTVDFYGDSDFEVMNLYGAWTRERQVSRIPIGRSGHLVDSKRGASSHEQNPFLALLRPETDEFSGDVYSMSLVYSGSFMAEAAVNSYGKTRMQIGLQEIDFQWQLEPSGSFTTPEALLVFSPDGLNGMSGIYHRLFRERLCPAPWSKRERPVLMNNWEATYFDFNEEKIKALIDEGHSLGMELFVLDDGWFGRRDSDASGLGDWFTNLQKLPGGLKSLSDYAHRKGMQFGLWFEPEMISPDSDLYRSHPDWCLHVPGRYRSEGRNQLVLDMGRQEIQDYLYCSIAAILSENGIDYVKWDMNRNITEAGSAALPSERQKETSHRYILGLYSLMDRLVNEFPEILFESCSGGGGRFDPGMLYYMPQTWTSDNTDSYERLFIQWGTSYLYPPVTMGAHVSEVPNHQVKRITPIETRGNAAMSANLGYELDLMKLSSEEREKVAKQVEFYKKIRRTIQFGDFIRLLPPSSDRGTAWMTVSDDGAEVLVFYFGHLLRPNDLGCRLKLRSLNTDRLYMTEDGEKYYGSELMYAGISLPPLDCDFDSRLIRLQAI
ncbi:MAG: alpha-galactosidase [Spirochaetales bacterium]|nr:alpha-galactosidase [Spirochaetales bacterium]